MKTYLQPGMRQVAFVGDRTLIAALDMAAGYEGTTRAQFVRAVVADHLRQAGLFPAEAPAFQRASRRTAGAAA